MPSLLMRKGSDNSGTILASCDSHYRSYSALKPSLLQWPEVWDVSKRIAIPEHLCCWARRDRVTGDWRKAGQSAVSSLIIQWNSPKSFASFCLIILKREAMLVPCRAVDVIREDICTICMELVMAGVQNKAKQKRQFLRLLQ